MALKMTVNYKTLTLPEAYLRVVRPQIDLSKDAMSFGVWMFPSQDAAADIGNMLDDAAIAHSGVPYDMSGGNAFEQAYCYLKTLPEYEGAIDVLEVEQSP
ncbi:hypothetical protein [Paraburkholderia pallida]|uniref:Uncharacterized protein n=1 Tax=Paraburkholderia pallida TaxID=2547399 RepID=A0A4P7CW09_9BURK|nr:hypothetical protein [Paraburkholderia pallida]QBQ98163.1 hypothetical protein E1956_13925 [Paraburkholderia pallida]